MYQCKVAFTLWTYYAHMHKPHVSIRRMDTHVSDSMHTTLQLFTSVVCNRDMQTTAYTRIYAVVRIVPTTAYTQKSSRVRFLHMDNAYNCIYVHSTQCVWRGPYEAA